MNERYRWNDPSRSPEDRERRQLERRAEAGWRGEDYGRYPGDRDDRSEHRGAFERRAEEAGRWVREHTDLSGRRERAERDAPNHAWDGRREPYPKDLGGINRPGEAERHTRDPLLGPGRDERGFRGQEERSYQGGQGYGQSGYSQGAYGGEYGKEGGYGSSAGGYGQGQYGANYGGRNDRQQRDYSHQAYGRNGPERYVEGGYESGGGYGRHHDRDEEERSWWRKARDEFNAWLGDREAEHRRRMDHARDEQYARGGGDWRGHDDDTAWRDPINRADTGYRADVSRNDGWREEGRDRPEPRDHRPGWFRDDRGGGRPW